MVLTSSRDRSASFCRIVLPSCRKDRADDGITALNWANYPLVIPKWVGARQVPITGLVRYGVNQDFGSDTTKFDLRDDEALLLAVIVQFNFARIREPKFQVPLFVARPVDVNRDL